MSTPQLDRQFPDTPEGMLELLGSMTDEELQELFEAHSQLEAQLREFGPKNDDELHAWILDELGIDIPRVAVCENHDAPFTFLADLFFDRIDAALGVANRGGAKTFLVAVLHWLNSKFKPGCESVTFGAVEQQSYRAYAHLKGWIYTQQDGQMKLKPGVLSSLMRETQFANGSKIEVLGSTPEQVNGPHPQKSHADEIELMREDTWKESRNMTISKQIPTGSFDPVTKKPLMRVIKPQDISTSTRKGPSGRVQELIDEIEKAVREGFKPPRQLYIWCIKETAAEVPNCRCAPEFIRRARLKQLGKDPRSLCECDKVRRGEHENGEDRLLMHVCKGDFFKSRGWQPFGDVRKQFTENDEETFTAQQLCQKPEMKWHYLPTFSEERHGIKNYKPRFENGPIFQSVDWGGTNPHAVNWYQLLTNEVEVEGHLGEVKRLKEGTLVCFDEIYTAEIGNTELGEMVLLKEAKWRQELDEPNWRVYERYADPQGKSARLDWKAMKLRCVWHVTREFDEHIKTLREFFDAKAFAVATDKCKMFVREAKAWRRDERTGNQIDEFNHCMSNFRYAAQNIKKVRRKAAGAASAPTARSIPRQAGRTTVVRSGRPSVPVSYRGKQDEFDNWRQRLGSPVTR